MSILHYSSPVSTSRAAAEPDLDEGARLDLDQSKVLGVPRLGEGGGRTWTG